MKEQKLKELVTLACRIDREIAIMKDQLADLKEELVHEAGSRDDEHVTTEGGGWSWTCEGTDGCVCRVTKPGDSLKPSIDGEGKSIDKIRDASGPHFNRLFLQAPKWKLVADFREQATSLLGKTAGKLIKLCSKASTPSVSFETKDLACLVMACLIPFLAGCFYTPTPEEKEVFWLKQIAIEEKQQTAYLQQIASAIEQQPAQLKRISDDVHRAMLKAYPLSTRETCDEADRVMESWKERQ